MYTCKLKVSYNDSQYVKIVSITEGKAYVFSTLIFFFFSQHLRQAGIAGKFVEFFGPGVSHLSVPDRTTIANMCPEYNATISFFPIDQVTLKHFRKTSQCQQFSELNLQINQLWLNY